MANKSASSRNRDDSGRSVSELTNHIEEAGATLAARAKETAANVAQAAGDVPATAAQKPRAAASSLARGAGEVASDLGRKADTATAAVGDGMQALATTIREKGPEDGRLGSASTALARTLG